MRAMLVPSPIPAATHAFRLELDLEAAMACREFWKDLYYRLNVVEIRVPPLREPRRDSGIGRAVPRPVQRAVRSAKRAAAREKLDDPAAADRQAAFGDLRKQRLVA
jgi:transcriptional regulator with GAF, ATPase, and Fis domain